MNTNKKMFWGIFLIFLGIMGVIDRLHIFGEYFEYIVVGSGFIIMYILRGAQKKYGNIGFLLIGCIILSAIPIDIIDKTSMLSTYKDPLLLVIIGTVFLLTYLIHTVWVPDVRKGSKTWPVIVAVIIYLVSALDLLTEIADSEIGRLILNNLWPVILILAGIVILVRNFTKNKF